MSYILEALKKAQAERQLGNAPDIHTPAPLQVATPAPGPNRKPLLLGLGAGVLVAGVVGVLAWRAQAPGDAQPAVLAQAPAAATAQPVPAPAPAVAHAPAAPQAPLILPDVPADTAPPVPARPMPAAPAPTPPAPAPAPRRAPGQPAAASAPAPRDAVPEAVYLPAPARVAETPAPRPPEPPLEENLRTLQQLPDAIQREVPKVSFGGYIYSPNPADRLLLVDKMLRREGEEVAPGLVLERLLPKYAVMNYRGTRYRVGY
ncbi:general secretion pathway protein GspB [Massilia sp. Se16.2.3]|nr:general secretion pathway protein GspB [Massilia sp. Se16.2.3]